MATYYKFRSFVEDLAEKKHDFSSDTFKIALTNSSPTNTNTQLSNITEISYTYCSSRTLTLASSSQTLGTYKADFNDITLTASGGSVGPFRYVVIYNDTVANDLLVCWFDYGSSLTLSDGQSLTINFNASGLFTLE